jgi:two-component system sensor histidine kinase YesM
MWKRFIRLIIWPHSLKQRLILALLLSTSIPLVLIGVSSYHTIYSILDNKIEEGVQNNLLQVQLSLENSLSHLNHVSQQLSFDGSTGKNLRNYLLENNDLFEKKMIYDEIVNELNLIIFTNPTLGLIFYYIPSEDQVLFPEYEVVNNFSLNSLPILADYSDRLGFTYYGPHRTTKKNNAHVVLSIAREVQILEEKKMYVFIETEFKLVQDLLKTDEKRMNTSRLIVDNDGAITYSDNSDFKIGQSYINLPHNEYYYFEAKTNQGWMVVSVIPKSEYNWEINSWLFQFFIYSVSSLGISILFAWFIWMTINKPLRSFNNEIKLMSRSNFHSPIKFTHIKEFDFLLNRFHDMRQKVWELIKTVEEKEKRKAFLEVQKLLNQINPHFIHNTLDTIRWLARMEGQDEIDRLVSTLNKVLYYNLGKGKTATIEDEIQALRNYVSLQQIRYNFQFDVRIIADSEIGAALVPRFILQPLVENSLYHGGIMDNGVIQVNISRDNETHILIQVVDNGVGMEESVMRQLLDHDHEDNKKAGLGIGMNYVNRMIKFQFGDDAQFEIASEINVGTKITMRIPFQVKEDDNESPDR